jgi:multiple sugar transport system substrate-binding protein
MRNCPYIYSLESKKDGSSKVAGKFEVAPLPGLKGPGTSSLGGHNVALSSSAKNKATAIDFMKFFTNEQNANFALGKASLAPPYESLYDGKLVKKFPYLPTLKQSILHAKPRPRVVNYGDASSAMQREAYAAMTGTKSTKQALKDLQKALQKPTAQQ